MVYTCIWSFSFFIFHSVEGVCGPVDGGSMILACSLYSLILTLSLCNFQLAMSKRGLEQNSQLYELDGPEALGSYLRIQPCSDDAPELSKCSIQWYRVSSQGGKKELISGIYMFSILVLIFLNKGTIIIGWVLHA